MSVTLSDEQYRIMVNALATVANGYVWKDGKIWRRVNREESTNLCRRALTELNLDWKGFGQKTKW